MQEFRIWTALLRLAVGATWIFEAYPQLVTRDTYLGAGFVKLVQSMASGNPWHFYSNFLDRVVLPHASVFSYLTLAGNLLVGVCLLLGLLTPYAASAAMLLNINYALADGWLNRTYYSLNAVMFFAELLLLAMAAGQTFGVDAVLGSRPPQPRRRGRL